MGGGEDGWRRASCGVCQLTVTQRPRLGLLISGDELLSPGLLRGPGQIWESNSVLLAALLEQLGYGVTLQRLEGGAIQVLPRLRVRLDQELRRGAGRPELARARLVVAADLLLEIPAELGNLEAGTQLWAQLLRLPIF